MADLGDYTEYDPDDDAEEPSSADVSGNGASADGDASADADAFEEVDATVAGEDRGIGTVAVSEGLCIGEAEDETTLRAYVTADNRPNVRIGKYLLVPYPNEGGRGASTGEKLFCRITALEYVQEYASDDATEIHARRAMRKDGIDEADYKFLASLEPVAVLYEESAEQRQGKSEGSRPSGDEVSRDSAETPSGGEPRDDGELKRRMTDRVPKPETPVREATDASEIKTGLKMPDDGVFLGHLSVGGEKVRTAAEPPTIDYRLKDDYEDGDPLAFRHTLVAGGTGSGKTHASKNVLRQFLDEERTYDMEDGRQARAAVVQFDPQDEYAQMHDDNPEITAEDRRRYEREGVAHGGHNDTKALVPVVDGTSYGTDHHRAEQVEFTIPFSMVRSNRWLIAGGSLNDNQFNALDVLVDRFFRQYGDEGTYDQFRSFLDDPALREELDESGRVHEATFDAVTRRVRGFGDVFDADARPITDLVSELVRPGGLTVVPTYHVNDTRATEVIVLAVSSLLIDQKLSNAPTYDRIKETPLVVGMDEAHNFLTDAESVQARKVIGKFTDAAKQGRKERLGLFLITQDPQDIADSVFKQINTTVVLNLGDEDAISSVNIPSSLEGKVPYMEKGQMVVYSPDNSEPVELIGLSKCLTKHGRE